MSRPKTTVDLVKRLQDTATGPKERVALQALATEMVQVFAFLSDIVKIPLQLDALCYIWEDKNADSGNDLFKNAAHSTTTSTAIYLAIEDKLWRKDIPRLEICDSRGKPVTKSRVRAFRTREQIRELVRVEASFLQSLAFSGLVSETLYFDERYCDNVKIHMDAPHLRLAGSVDDVLLNVSCLRTLETSIASMPPDQTTTMDLHRTYHFIHLTYQEFFAAHYFVACWTAGKDLAFVISKNSQKQVIGTDEFIADHKYDTRYRVFWRFVAGLLHSGIHSGTDNSGTACLGRFFYALEREPRDILDFEHQKLVVQCLVEADPAQDMALFDPHRSLLKEWVAYEYNRLKDVRLLRMIPFPERISGLIVPDETGNLVVRNTSLTWSKMMALYLPLRQGVPPNLCIIDTKGRIPDDTYRVLLDLPFLPPDALQAITEHLHRSPINYSDGSRFVLSRHLDDAVPCILDCLRHTTGFVRANAAIVCAQIAGVKDSLPLEVVAALVDCVDDAFKRAAFYAMFALCKVQPFPQDAVGAICAQLRNRKKSVRMSAAKAVVQAEMLPMEVFQKITSLLLDPVPGVRSAAMKVFRARQDPLPDSVVAQLAQFLGSPNEAETAAAVGILRRGPRAVQTLMRASRLHRGDDASNTHRPVLDELIVLLHNGSTPQIRAAAAQLFQRTVGPLPAHIYEQLARGLADPSFDVRGYVAVALSYHTSPFVPGVDRIVLDILSQAEKFPHKIKLHLFRLFPIGLPLSPATIHVLAPKVWDVRTASCIRRWILAVFRSRRGRLPESILQTLAGFQQSHFLANSMPDTQHSTALEQMTKYRPLDDVYIRAQETIARLFAEYPSLPEGVVSSLLEQLSSGDGDGKYSIALRSCSRLIITALSHPELVSQPVLTGILSCLASSDVGTRREAEYTLYQKSTLPLNILQPLLEYTMRDKGALESLLFPKHIFEHIVALPDAELASLFSAGNEYARFMLKVCLHRSIAYERDVQCYADGESHYEFVFRGKRRRIPKTCFPVNPKHILRELGVPVGLPRVGEEKMAETVQGGKGEDGQKGYGGDDEKYRSGHIFVIFVVLFIWASFYFSSVY